MPPQNTLEPTTGKNEKHTQQQQQQQNQQQVGAVATVAPNETNGKSLSGSVVFEKKEPTPVKTTSVIVPPDGGWGWVVMIASFSCNIIVDGVVFSAGMFHEEFGKEFNATKAETALISSLLSGFYLLAGPFVSALANRWGFRPVTIIGAVIASSAFAISYMAQSVLFLYISYGFIGGIGFCLIYMPSVITVGYYFEKWRALATGISLCGSGVGTFIFAPLCTYLINTFGWRQSLLILAGLILICGFLGIAYRPIKPIQVAIDENPEKNKLLFAEGLPTVYTKPLPEGRFAYSVPNSSHNTWIGVNNTQYPTAAEVFRNSGVNLDRRPSATSGGVSANLHSTTKKLEQFKRLSSQSSQEDEVKPTVLHQELKTVGEDEEENEAGALLEDDVKPVMLTARRHTVSGRRPNEPTSSRGSSRRGTITDGSRPMYRDDIFFSGSLVRIPQYQSQTSIGYHMSVTRLPTKQDVQEETEAKCKICPEAVRRTLATMLDVSLLKSPSFMLLALSGFFTMMGFFVPFIYATQRATLGGMDQTYALFIISAIGISNTIARIVCGLLSSFKGVNALHLNNVAITLGGLATMFSGYSMSVAYQFTFAAIFGIAIGI